MRDQPLIRRITLSVLVDQVAVKGADGVAAWQDRPAEELGRIATLARNAIGFDEKRGDKVDVVSLRFSDGEEPVEAAKTAFLGLAFDKADILRVLQTGLMAAVAVLALLLVVRPMVLRLTTEPQRLADASAGGPDGLLLGGPAGAVQSGGGKLAIAGPDGGGEEEGMVMINNIDGAMRASSLRQVAGLVDKHPEESLAVMRGWMMKEAS